MIVYHIDRTCSLCEGMELTLSSDGLSRHGLAYWSSVSTKSIANINNFFIEHVFEEVRLSHYPDKPSRFTSAFGSLDWTQLNYWGSTLHGVVNPPVWQIETPFVYLADASLLCCQENDMYNLARARSNAHRYWQGAFRCDSAAQSCESELAARPSAEALIALPAKVLCRL